MNKKVKSLMWTAGALLIATALDKALGISSTLSSFIPTSNN